MSVAVAHQGYRNCRTLLAEVRPRGKETRTGYLPRSLTQALTCGRKASYPECYAMREGPACTVQWSNVPPFGHCFFCAAGPPCPHPRRGEGASRGLPRRESLPRNTICGRGLNLARQAGRRHQLLADAVALELVVCAARIPEYHAGDHE